MGCDNIQPVPRLKVGDVIDSLDGVRRCASTTPKELRRDDRDIPVDAYHSDPVRFSSDGSGNMRAVIVDVTARPAVVDRIIVFVEIPSVGIVDIAVAVIVEPVDRIETIGPNLS